MSGVIDTAEYMIPIYGTYKSIRDAVNKPTLGNIGMAGLSALSDAGMIFGVGAAGRGALGALKAGRAAAKAVKTSRRYAPQIANDLRKAEGVARGASRKFNYYQKLAVPVERFDDNQAYLRVLDYQKKSAINKLNQLRNQSYTNKYLSTQSPVRYGIQKGFSAFPSRTLTIPLGSSAAKATGVSAYELSR